MFGPSFLFLPIWILLLVCSLPFDDNMGRGSF
jgi:hypothetical protein